MVPTDKTIQPVEVENIAEELPPGTFAKGTLEFERAHLLANLPDPDADKSEDERRAIDKRLMWKVDLRLIPWLSLLYLLSFLDRTNIGNARLENLEGDLNMVPGDYNMTLTIFFISYALAEPLTNTLLKMLTPRMFFSAIIFTWGVIMTLMGLVKNQSGLLAARFFLGLAEAGLFPGVNYYLGCWYKSSEIGLRSSIFLAAAALSGSFGGLLAAAIAKMDGVGGMPGWSWIFMLEGIATTVVGIVCWWMVFDWPDSERGTFLSPDDRIRIQRRLIMDRQGRTAEDFDKRYIYAAVKDWKTYVYVIIFTGCTAPLYAFSLFLPTILRGMGYYGTRGQLMSVPPYALAALFTIAIGYTADRTRLRGIYNVITACLGIAGFLMLLSTSNPRIQYAGTFLGAAGIYPAIPNTLSWVNNNTEGSLKRAFVLGMVVGVGNLNGIVSSNIYLDRERPRYWSGHAVVLGYEVLFLLGGSVFMSYYLRRMNKSRRAGGMDAKWDSLTEQEKWIAGDMRPDFSYVL